MHTVFSYKGSGDCWCLQVPAPQRGEIVRQMGEALRQKKALLGKLVSATDSDSNKLVTVFNDINEVGTGLTYRLVTGVILG